jgi:hypothetical protein
MAEVELHNHGEVEVTGVEPATFRDSCRGQASGFPSSTRLAPPQVDLRLKANEACGRDLEIVFVLGARLVGVVTKKAAKINAAPIMAAQCSKFAIMR